MGIGPMSDEAPAIFQPMELASGALRQETPVWDEVVAWAYCVSAIALLLYPLALLLWTAAEGSAAHAATLAAAEDRRKPALAKEDVRKRHSALQAPVRRRPWLLPGAVLAAAATLLGAAALDFAIGAPAKRVPGRPVQPATQLRAARLETATLVDKRQSSLPELTDRELRQLNLGLEVQRQDIQDRRGSGLFVVDVRAPPSVVFNCLQAFESYPNMIPSVRGADIRGRVTQGKGSFSARAHYKVSRFSLGLSVVHSVDAEEQTVKFDLDQAAAKLVLQEAQGSWRVEERPGGRSRVWLQIQLQATKFLPRWLVDYAAERAMKRATSWLKPFVERLSMQAYRGRPMRNPPNL